MPLWLKHCCLYVCIPIKYLRRLELSFHSQLVKKIMLFFQGVSKQGDVNLWNSDNYSCGCLLPHLWGFIWVYWTMRYQTWHLHLHITKYLPDTECMQNSYQTKLSSLAMGTPHYTLWSLSFHLTMQLYILAIVCRQWMPINAGMWMKQFITWNAWPSLNRFGLRNQLHQMMF